MFIVSARFTRHEHCRCDAASRSVPLGAEAEADSLERLRIICAISELTAPESSPQPRQNVRPQPQSATVCWRKWIPILYPQSGVLPAVPASLEEDGGAHSAQGSRVQRNNLPKIGHSLARHCRKVAGVKPQLCKRTIKMKMERLARSTSESRVGRNECSRAAVARNRIRHVSFLGPDAPSSFMTVFISGGYILRRGLSVYLHNILCKYICARDVPPHRDTALVSNSHSGFGHLELLRIRLSWRHFPALGSVVTPS